MKNSVKVTGSGGKDEGKKGKEKVSRTLTGYRVGSCRQRGLRRSGMEQTADETRGGGFGDEGGYLS